MYLEDLSYIHNHKCATFAKDAGEGILQLLARSSKKRGLVVDLGCGTGEVIRLLVEKGYQGLGIDQSSSILEIAKAKVPSASFIEGSFFEVPLPKSHAVISTCMSLNYAFRKDHLKSIEGLFQKIYDSLEMGGCFIFDLLGPGVIRDDVEYAECPDGTWSLILHTRKVPDMRMQTEEYTIFRKQGELFRKTKEVHVSFLYPQKEVEELLEKVGFAVNPFSSHGSYRLDAKKNGHIGYFCKKANR